MVHIRIWIFTPNRQPTLALGDHMGLRLIGIHSDISRLSSSTHGKSSRHMINRQLSNNKLRRSAEGCSTRTPSKPGASTRHLAAVRNEKSLSGPIKINKL